VNPEIEEHPLNFHGEEGAYFRIWLVNVLLGIVTLGIYTPWARRRTVQYFYQNTEMAGDSFEFTAPIGRMVKGFLLFAGLYFAWNLASGSANPTTQLVGQLCMLVALLAAPWLWASAMRFRLGHTRWRGLRLRFQPGTGELYTASWPLLALVVLGFAAGMSTFALRAYGPFGMMALVLASLFLMLLCLALLQYNYARLLVLRTHIGTQAGRWKVERAPYLRIALQAAGLGVLLLGCVLGLAWLLRGVLTGGRGFAVVLGLGLAASAWLLAMVPALAWREARTFQLVWSHTGVANVARFRCTLSAGTFIALRIRNALLNLVTLGLYRPFARIKVYRMKCESVSLFVRGGTDVLVGSLARQQEEGGFGDALADHLGLDIVGA